MGCALLDKESRSVPIQKASATLMAMASQRKSLYFGQGHAPVPSTPEAVMADMIPHGTATDAFEASSLM